MNESSVMNESAEIINENVEATVDESSETTSNNKKRKTINVQSWVFKEGHFIKVDDPEKSKSSCFVMLCCISQTKPPSFVNYLPAFI